MILWDSHPAKELGRLKGHTGSIFCVANLGKNHIVSGSEDKTLRVWCISSAECIHVMSGVGCLRLSYTCAC